MDYRQKRERRERRRRLIGSIVAAIAVLALVAMSVAPAFASGGQEFTHYWVEALVHEDGRVDVEIDLEYDFGAEESHGVYLTYLTRQRIEGARTTIGCWTTPTSGPPAPPPQPISGSKPWTTGSASTSVIRAYT